jgi:hypothetical protein
MIRFGSSPSIVSQPLRVDESRGLSSEMMGTRHPVAVDGTDGQRALDGHASSFRTHDNHFALADPAGHVITKLIEADDKDVLTPMYWSPDSQYLAYVQKSRALDREVLSVMSGGRDIMVLRLRDGARGRVAQVYEDFPWEDLGWVIAPLRIEP